MPLFCLCQLQPTLPTSLPGNFCVCEREGLQQPKPSLKSLLYQGWHWNPGTADSTSQVVGFQACATMLDLCRTGTGNLVLDHLHVLQAFCHLSHFPSPVPVIFHFWLVSPHWLMLSVHYWLAFLQQLKKFLPVTQWWCYSSYKIAYLVSGRFWAQLMNGNRNPSVISRNVILFYHNKDWWEAQGYPFDPSAAWQLAPFKSNFHDKMIIIS